MVSQAPRVCVVIAAYNEAPVIASVVADVKRAGYGALVIDDGSTDATGAVAAEAGGSVVRHPINLGQGAGLQTGIEFALSEGADVIVTFDADGQHRAADIAVLIDALARQGADFALGSRFLGTSLNQPLSRLRSTSRCRGACCSRRRPCSRASQPDCASPTPTTACAR